MINNIKDAERLAYKYFKDKVDKGGNPYMEHLKHVSDKCNTENSKIVGMLHDIIEDTNISFSELESELHINLIESIQRLTKYRDMKYSKYIDNIVKSNDLIAIEVKMHDLEHNMKLSRLKEIRQVDIDRVKKYRKAYDKIKNKYYELNKINIIDGVIKEYVFNGNLINNRKLYFEIVKNHADVILCLQNKGNEIEELEKLKRKYKTE